ncbi:hypothetical protein GX586_12775 [bacterium]|nr:hypothetical protein [bacterium]
MRLPFLALMAGMLLTVVPAYGNTLRFDPTNTFQTMDGVGANTYTFPYGSSSGWQWNAVTSVFDEVHLRYFRTAPWLSWWETVNDNTNPLAINWAGFQTVNRMADWYDVPYGKWLTARGYEVGLGVWGFEDWLEDAGVPAAYPEIAETLAAYVIYQRISNSVAMNTYEVQNEPALSANKYPSPDALVTGALAVIDMFDRYGLTNLMLHGPNHHAPAGTVAWAGPWFSNETLRARTTALSFHTYWSQNQSDYAGIWNVAQRYNKPVWATEVTGMFWDGSQWQITFTNWACAWDQAMRYYRSISWSHASRLYQWTILGHDAVVGTAGERQPCFYALKHFANFIPPGSLFVGSSLDDSSMYSMMFKLTNGSYTAIILNDRTLSNVITITPPVGQFTCTQSFSSTQYGYYLPGAAAYPDEQRALTMVVPAKSISSMELLWIPEPCCVLPGCLAIALARFVHARRRAAMAARHIHHTSTIA